MELELSVLVDPEFSDGYNNWYVTSGEVNLIPYLYENSGEVSTLDVYWAWDSQVSYTSYSGENGVSESVGYIPAGIHTLYYYASGDTVSGESAVSDYYYTTLSFTDVVPTVDLIAPSGASLCGVERFHVFGSDAISGINGVFINIGSKRIYELQNDDLIFDFDTRGLLDGYYTVYGGAYNYAGLISTSGLPVVVDNSYPLITINDYSQTISGSTYTFSGTALDTYSNIEEVEYSSHLVGHAEGAWTPVTYTSGENTTSLTWEVPLSGLSTGTLIMYMRASDVLGNITPASQYNVVIAAIA